MTILRLKGGRNNKTSGLIWAQAYLRFPNGFLLKYFLQFYLTPI